MSKSGISEFERSLEIGEKAFSELTLETIPVWPTMYEVLYNYEEGDNKDLVAAINVLRETNEALSIDQLQEVHEEFLSSNKLAQMTDDIGGKINEEIRKIVGAVRKAGEKSDQCDLALQKIETKFPSIQTPQQLHGVVSLLSDITNAIADNNRNLNNRLQRSSQQIDILHRDLQQARNESNTDALTGLANRKKFDLSIAGSLNEFNGEDIPFSLLLLDIDHFKRFNDTYGHQTGDNILRLVGMMLKSALKGKDLAARYGGEEFAIIMAEARADNAFKVAEQIRDSISKKELLKRSSGETLGHITISIGIAECEPGDTAETLIEKADKALYSAKENGRNQCIIHSGNTGLEDHAQSA